MQKYEMLKRDEVYIQHPVLLVGNGAGNLLNIERTRGRIDNILINSASFVDFVGVATLLHTAVLERIDVIGVDDL